MFAVSVYLPKFGWLFFPTGPFDRRSRDLLNENHPFVIRGGLPLGVQGKRSQKRRTN
jgi:hypothetical protein